MNEVNLGKREELLSICKRIITDPRKFWEEESTEEEDVFQLYKRVGFILIGAPFVIRLLGIAVVDQISSQILLTAAVGFALALCLSYVTSWIMHWLSPRFGGQKNLTGALKLNLYSHVPSALVAITTLFGVGALAMILQLVGGIWGLVITYMGVPKMLGIPRERLVPFILTTWAVLMVLSFCFQGIAG